MTSYLRTGTSLTALALTTALASPSFGQETPEPPSARNVVLNFAQESEWNLGGNRGLSTQSVLGLVVSSRTRTQSLSFSADTTVDLNLNGGGGISADELALGLTYSRRGANSDFRFNATRFTRDLGIGSFELAPGLFLIGDEEGEVEAESYRVRTSFGVEGPFGVSLDARFRARDYENTVNPELIDEEFYSIDALARFSVSRALEFRLLAGVANSDEEDLFLSERELQYVGFGVSGEMASGLAFSADVFLDQAETTTEIPATVTEQDGVGFALQVSQPRPNGTIGIGLSSRVDDVGRRTTAEFNRTLNLPDGGLSFSLGVVDQEGIDDLQFVGGVSYSVARKNAEITATLQQAALSSGGDTLVSTNLALAYRRQITQYSSWEAELSYLATDELVANESEDETKALIGYRRDLNSDWSMFTGYEYTKGDGSPQTSIFLNLERDITFGF